MKLRAFSLLALAMAAAIAYGQVQNPPTAPRTQSPAQDGAQPGAAQPGQPGSPNQFQPGVQQPGGQQRTANYRGESAGQSSQMIDGHLAACLILGNEEEVALGRFAGQRANSEQVKKFAQQMVDAHGKASQQLRQFAPQGASLQLTGAGGDQGRNEARTTLTQDAASSAAGAQTGAQQQMLNIARDAKQECLNLTQKELGEKRGAEFDECYIGQQIGGHIQMIAALTAFERHSSPELQRVLAEQKKTAEQHLDHLKQLANHMKTSSSAGDRSSDRSSTALQPGSQQR